MTRSRPLAIALVLLWLVQLTAMAKEPGLLNEQERAWVAAHPTLRVAVSTKHVPFEYLENKALRGLTSEYVKVIARKTGLKLTPVPVEDLSKREMLALQRADLSFVVTHSGQRAPDPPGFVLIPSQQSHPLLIVSRIGLPLIADVRQLNGRTVSVPDQWPFQAELQALAPEAKIVTGVRMFDVLAPVVDGTADAAIGSELLLLPYIHRRMEGRLQVAGIYGERVARMTAMVGSDQPLLQSIVHKALVSITPDEAHQIYDNWLDFESLQIPSMQALTRHYPHEIGLSVLVVLLLIGLIYQAHAQRRQARLNEKEKAKFLAVMSHEIRSPMNAVLAAVELLRHTDMTPQQRHFADLANNGGRNLLRLLDDVLDMSKLEAGQVRLETAAVDIAALVQAIAELHRLQADHKGIALTVRTRVHATWLLLDETRVAQILHNLVSNAVKFTAVGGVAIDVALSTTDDGLRLVITVADTGIGISAQALARLFQPYAQADNTYRRSGGTGLGLVISRELATLMQGTLTLESHEGQGSTAVLSMKVEAAPAGAAVPQEAAAPALPLEDFPAPSRRVRPSLGARILIVEDVLANQEVLRAQVQTCGCRAVVAENGAQALARFEDAAFDLVLMDCDLPDQDGYSITQSFRRIEAQRNAKPVPIIAISASTDPQHVERCFDAGMDGVLTKPIQLGKLQDAIHLWCGVAGELKTAPPCANEGWDMQAAQEVMKKDLDGLLGACERQDHATAVRWAHRLRGAALVMEWSELADAAAKVESLLRTASAAQDLDKALQDVVQAWNASASDLAHGRMHQG